MKSGNGFMEKKYFYYYTILFLWLISFVYDLGRSDLRSDKQVLIFI